MIISMQLEVGLSFALQAAFSSRFCLRSSSISSSDLNLYFIGEISHQTNHLIAIVAFYKLNHYPAMIL